MTNNNWCKNFLSLTCPGEAEYTNQTPAQPEELFGVFVTSNQANAHIVSIDASAALVSQMELMWLCQE